MKQDLNHARRVASLLIAAAALPLTPAFAQDTQPAPPPPAEAAPPPAAQSAPAPAPVEVQAPAPTVTAAPPPTVNIPPPATTATTSPRTAAPPARAATRTPVRAPSSFATASRSVRTAPATVTVAPAPVAVTTTTAAPAPVATTAPPAIAPAPEPIAAAPAPVAPATQPADSRGRVISVLPWLLIGLVLLGLVALLAKRRRRREDVVYEEDYAEAPVAPAVAPVEPVVAAPAMAAAPVAAELRRPWIDLQLEPVRAGVEGEEAVVEFALKVDNRGGAAARDVRVSAFMLQSGASEAERSLIAPKEMPAVNIAAGETKQVETAVALPTDRLRGDAVLPVVVADARYTLPDGSEGHTSASFAVGVPDGEELAHFAVDNPSGLHDDVVARPVGEMEKA